MEESDVCQVLQQTRQTSVGMFTLCTHRRVRVGSAILELLHFLVIGPGDVALSPLLENGWRKKKILTAKCWGFIPKLLGVRSTPHVLGVE
jgi:hypothetical protein